MKLQLKVNDDGIIEDAKFKTFGCGSAIASSSLVTEWVKGKSITEAGLLKNSQIAEELSLPPVKIHCSVLAEEAVKAAIFDYKFKKGLLSLEEVTDHAQREDDTDEAVRARATATVETYATKHNKRVAA